MSHFRFAAFTFATICTTALSADQIDDRALQAAFNRHFEPIADSGSHVDTATLRQQLKEREATDPIDLTAPKTEHLTPVQIYQQRKASVVALGSLYKCGKCDKWHNSLAGGVILTADGVILTNYHVADNAQAEVMGAITADGDAYAVTEVLAASKDDDLALVRVDTGGKELQPAPVAYDEPVGADVVAISHPDSRYFTLTKGTISRYYAQWEPKRDTPMERMAVTADYARGSSGCPIFNDRGAVIGLVSSTQSIYYSKEEGVDKNLQMVVKSTIPMASLKRLFKTASE